LHLSKSFFFSVKSALSLSYDLFPKKLDSGRRCHRHRLLLKLETPDDGREEQEATVNQRFDIKHVKDDLRKIGLPDGEVYALAVQLKRLIVTCF